MKLVDSAILPRLFYSLQVGKVVPPAKCIRNASFLWITDLTYITSQQWRHSPYKPLTTAKIPALLQPLLFYVVGQGPPNPFPMSFFKAITLPFAPPATSRAMRIKSTGNPLVGKELGLHREGIRENCRKRRWSASRCAKSRFLISLRGRTLDRARSERLNVPYVCQMQY